MKRCKCGVAACKCAKVRDIQIGLNLYLVLNTRTRDPAAETRDLTMKQRQLCRDAVPTLPKQNSRPDGRLISKGD